MKLHFPPVIHPSNEMLRHIASIDEFKGEWRALGQLEPEVRLSLRRLATIESVGSSTRIEGARLSDEDVAGILGNLQAESFRSRDEQEVAGYAYVMETVQVAWQDLPLTQGFVLQLHRDLLRYSHKDERHRGAWKTSPNHVAAFDGERKEIGIVFEAASPFDTPKYMEELLAWYVKEEATPVLHPLLRIAVFNVMFLAIHPFQDGNGRLSRVLTNLQLLRAGYEHASYSSLESVVEHHKDAYYLALRRTQTTLGKALIEWEPWLTFFLQAMLDQIERLRERLATTATPHSKIPGALPRDLSPLAGRLLETLIERRTLSVAEASDALHANRNTLKSKFVELVTAGYAELHGKGRGAHYRPAPRN